VLDTETTGFIPRVHRVIEYAAARVEDGKVTEEYTQLFKFAEPLPPHIRVLTGITDEDLKSQPTFAERKDEILARIPKDAVIVGQNIPFDIGMLKGEGLDLSDRAFIDTSMIASLVFPEFESYSLSYLSAKLNLTHEPVHRALGDVHATVELLAACWERLLELPKKELEEALAIMQRATGGTPLLFKHLTVTAKKRPTWLVAPEAPPFGSKQLSRDLPLPEAGTVQLLEEEKEPEFFGQLLAATLEEGKTTHIVAVKNLEACVDRVRLPAGITILYPPHLLLDPDAVARFEKQESYTADEATMALKILWYKPTHHCHLTLHGDERSVWHGKLACTDTSPTYLAQFKTKSTTYLIDHQQLLRILLDPEHPANSLLKGSVRIIVTDASMLEDTATKAAGAGVSIDDVRAAAAGNTRFTQFTDTLQVWVERTRDDLDLRYIAQSDLNGIQAKGLRSLIKELVPELDRQAQAILQDIDAILDPVLLPDRIVYIERQRDRQWLHSAPRSVASLLQKILFNAFPTTLVIPPCYRGGLPGILSPSTKTTRVAALRDGPALSITFPSEESPDAILKTPPAGKTILLCPGRRPMEDLFIAHAHRLENEGVTLLCQGLSGGQRRMEAEFAAAPEPAIWMITPWTYEGITLPPGTVDRLIIAGLPFDHPSHAVLSKRADQFGNPFEQYFLERLEMRLLRLIRAFCSHRKQGGAIKVIDPRIETKSYGSHVRATLEQFTMDAPASPPAPAAKAVKKKPAAKRAASKKEVKKKDDGQTRMF
jgi:DNA polymerase III epsilon subunit-like protein